MLAGFLCWASTLAGAREETHQELGPHPVQPLTTVLPLPYPCACVQSRGRLTQPNPLATLHHPAYVPAGPRRPAQARYHHRAGRQANPRPGHIRCPAQAAAARRAHAAGVLHLWRAPPPQERHFAHGPPVVRAQACNGLCTIAIGCWESSISIRFMGLTPLQSICVQSGRVQVFVCVYLYSILRI